MLSTVTHRTVGAALLMTVVAGCGGGGGGSSSLAPNPSQPPGSTTTAVTSSGVISGFSSVIVNGVRYQVGDDTVVSIEDEGEIVGDDSRLRVGMKVRIRATDDGAGDPLAERIEYDADLKGPVLAVVPSTDDPALGSFMVPGATVIVDGNTVFDDDVGDNNGDGRVDLGDLELPSGDRVVVEVSGLPTVDGIVATRVDRVDGVAGDPDRPGDEFEIEGFVDSVAADGSTFDINGTTFLVVTGAGGTRFEDGLRADASLVGVFVEVEADENAAGDLLAVSVERDDDVGDRDDDGDRDTDDRFGELEIEGILNAVDTSSDPHVVTINGTTLEVDDASSLVGREGNRVELEGVFDEAGVLILREAKLEVENSVRTEDRVAAVDPAAGTITTRLGLVIIPTGDSRVEDDTVEDDEGDHLTPAEFVERVQIDDFLEARGFPNGDDGVTWRRVELEDEDDLSCELRGPVASIAGDSAASFSFVIQGVTIDVSQMVGDDGFEGIDDAMGREAFFAALDVGDLVEAESDEQGVGCVDGTLTARKVEFEADDDVVGTVPDDDDGDDGTGGGEEIVGTPSDVGTGTFAIDGRTITVVGNTLIDDSLIELALGREFDDDDRRFDQLPEGLTLADLLTGAVPVSVTVDGDGVAVRIEDV